MYVDVIFAGWNLTGRLEGPKDELVFICEQIIIRAQHRGETSLYLDVAAESQLWDEILADFEGSAAYSYLCAEYAEKAESDG